MGAINFSRITNRTLEKGFASLLVLIPIVFTVSPARGQSPQTASPPQAIRNQQSLATPTRNRQEAIRAARSPAAAMVTVGGSWIAQGPGPALNGQSENVAGNNPVCGSVQTVLPHPTDPNILWVGGVNGGIWKTTNATAASPHWIPLTDSFPSLSIGALELDPTDATHQTLMAGNGRFSSFGRAGGSRAGLLRSTDGGSTWTLIDAGGTIAGKNISGIAPRGNTIVISVNVADNFTFANIGIFRSTDGGASFSQISGAPGSGLPAGRAFDLASDPVTSTVLYTAVRDAGTANGIYKSVDTGATWTRVSDAAMNALMTDASTFNTEMAVGRNNNVFVGIINNGRLAGLFRSGNGGTSWSAMDLPQTNEGGVAWGIHAGGQGDIHFSIAADPNNPNIVYVGGDRQPHPGPDGIEFTPDDSFPNSIGAFNFSGRLFRGDASVTPTGGFPSPQWTPLTHIGTASSSSPHADSREIMVDANGNLIEGDDGGVYRRINPLSTAGDWTAVVGDLQLTEFHDVAWDRNASIVIGGTQDTGTSEQITPSSTTWNSVSTGDGGDVAVDNISLAGANQSIRYSSFQNLAAFRKRTFSAANVQVGGTVFPALNVLAGGSALVPQFVTPVELNVIDPTRLLIVADNSIYESFDQGNNLTEVGPGLGPNASPGFSFQNAAVYGGRKGGVDNPDVFYVGAGTAIFVRTTAGGTISAASALPGGAGTIRDIVLDPNDWMSVFVIDADQVFQTTDAGATWTEITGDIAAGGADNFRAIQYVSSPGPDKLVVGTSAGVLVSLGPPFGSWLQLGSGLPNARVWDLDYDAAGDILLAGTLGRSAWTLTGVANIGINVPEGIPTVSQWGLFVLALVLLTGGAIVLTRRHQGAV